MHAYIIPLIEGTVAVIFTVAYCLARLPKALREDRAETAAQS